MEKDPLLLIEESCSVTAFDMKLAVTKDGRKRGLWFWLNDDSKDRQAQNKRISEDPDRRDWEKYKTHEAALIEWDELKKIYAAIGKELKNAPKESG